jgi:S1-C subfamily serine protease
MYLLLILLILQGCQAQDKKDENDIEEIQKNTAYTASKISYTGIVDFRNAAKIATPGVVNIKSLLNLKNNIKMSFNLSDPLKSFLKTILYSDNINFSPNSSENNSMPIVGSASGVLLTPDGYIITNNHVVKDALEINITLFDGRSYTAKLVGTDSQI